MSKVNFDEVQKNTSTAYQKNQEKGVFINDGYVLKTKWDELSKCDSVKLCYLTKEPTNNVDFKNLMRVNSRKNLENWFKNEKIYKFYRSSVLFSKAIIDTIADKPLKEFKFDSLDFNEKVEIFEKIACINVKKTSGEKNTSDIKEIIQYAITYKNNIKEELAALDPDILVLCGTGDAFLELYPCNELLYLSESSCDKEIQSVIRLNDKNSGWWFDILDKGFDSKKINPKLIINYYHFSNSGVDDLLLALGLNKILSEAICYMRNKKIYEGTRLYRCLCKN